MSNPPLSNPPLSWPSELPTPPTHSSSSHSTVCFNLSLSLKSLSHNWSCDFDFFVLIFVSLIVYISWFSVIIFVWILRKCEKYDKNGFFRAFSETQPNTRKYFPKYFLECNQTLENILHSKNILHSTKRSLSTLPIFLKKKKKKKSTWHVLLKKKKKVRDTFCSKKKKKFVTRLFVLAKYLIF